MVSQRLKEILSIHIVALIFNVVGQSLSWVPWQVRIYSFVHYVHGYFIVYSYQIQAVVNLRFLYRGAMTSGHLMPFARNC